jgi:uncharacterized membrane protein YoaK (UPF0700 family)
MPLHRLTSRHRSPAADWQLASLLALTAGTVDVSSYLALRQFTSHMSGTVATIAADIDTLRVILPPTLVLACFLLGATLCSLLVNWSRRRDLEGLFALPILLESLLLTLAALFASPHHLLPSLALLSFTMGLQNAVITKISHAVIRTTHVTGMITDIGIELGRALYWNRTTGRTPVRAERQHLLLLTLLVTLFFAGGAIGALAYPLIGFRALLPFALLLAAIAILPIAADLRHPNASSSL